MDFFSWFRQPTTITGIATVLGGAAATVANVATGSTSLTTLVGGAVFAGTHLLVNDNTATDVSKLAQTAVGAAMGGEPGVVSAAPTLVGEIFDLFRDLHDVPRSPATASAPTPAIVPGAGAPGI